MSQFREFHDVRKKEIAAGRKNWKTEDKSTHAHSKRAMSTKEEQKKDDAAKATDGAEAKTSGAEAIEEDDAFEEFEPSAWGAHDEDAEDVQQWQVRLNHMPVCVF